MLILCSNGCAVLPSNGDTAVVELAARAEAAGARVPTKLVAHASDNSLLVVVFVAVVLVRSFPFVLLAPRKKRGMRFNKEAYRERTEREECGR